jgi:cell division protein ZapA (FtsZ GTPase activity inhibitor)
MDKQRVEVEILGQKYAIRSEASPEYVRDLAAYVERRATEIRGNAVGQDPLRLLALAALYIADELFRLRDDREAADQDTGARLGALRDLLDSLSQP